MKNNNYFIFKSFILILIIGLILLSKTNFKKELIIIFSIWSFFEYIIYCIIKGNDALRENDGVKEDE